MDEILPDAPDKAWERDDPEMARLLAWWCGLPEAERRDARRLGAGRRVGPNDRCPCGSGRKAKKCCGRLVEEPAPTPTPQARKPLSPAMLAMLAIALE